MASKLPRPYPIENLWNTLKKKVATHKSKNIQELKIAIEKEWNFDADYLKNLIESMPNRLKEVIENKGYYTHY